MVPLKPALTYEQQIQKLSENHRLEITDREGALFILKSVNYYRLSGYGIGLRRKDNNELYKDGVSIDTLYRLYTFDSLFKNALMHVVEQIEIQLRTQIANYLAVSYGPESYTDSSLFDVKFSKDGSSIHTNIIESFKQECIHQKNVPLVKHHFEKYNGHFPIWVAIELFTFGNLASLYDIMKTDDKKYIASLYNTTSNHLSSWILSLVEIRNICAHYSRLYNMPLKQTPFLYSEHKQYRTGTINKVFPVLIVIKRILANNRNLWNSFYSSLSCLLEEYNDVVNLSFIGFPKNWHDILEPYSDIK